MFIQCLYKQIKHIYIHMHFGKLCQINTLGQQIPTGDKQTEFRLYVTMFKKKLIFVLHI